MRRTILIGAAILLADLSTANAAAVNRDLRAGPVYTGSRNENVFPVFPDVQILVEPPPAAPQAALEPNNFELRADGGTPVRARRVQALAASGHAMAVAVVVDVSGSMNGAPLNAIRNGLVRFVNEAGPQDRVSIQTIADDIRQDSKWGDSADQVRHALTGLAARGRFTHLWDGLLETVTGFPATPAARRIVVISDGHDEGSGRSLDQVITAARERQIPIDSIGITRSNPVYLSNLQRLSAETGGLFRRANSTDQLEKLTGAGIDRLKSLPVVDFRADSVRADGRVHQFEVIWKHDGSESTADISAAVPRDEGFRYRGWVAAAAATLALLVGAALVFRRSRRVARTALPPPAVPLAAAGSPSADSAGAAPAQQYVSAARAGPGIHDAMISAADSRGFPGQADVAPASPRSRTQLGATFQRASEDRPSAWLIGEEGFGMGTAFPVNATEFWIGANPNNHLQIADDPTVSGNHACIVHDHDVLGIFDYRSTNGTRVNGEPVRDTRRLLSHGDRIRIGRSTFILSATEDSGARR